MEPSTTMYALRFFATAINDIDRRVDRIFAPTLLEAIGWKKIEYGYIVF